MESESWEVIYEKIRRQFAEGAEARLANISGALDRLGRGETDPEVLRELLYEFHKLAGSAGSYGFGRISELSLEGELLCRAVTERDGAPTSEEIARWRTVLDAIAEEFAGARSETERSGGPS